MNPYFSILTLSRTLVDTLILTLNVGESVGLGGLDNYCPSLSQAEQPWIQDWMIQQGI
jgi:hypothetical protein